MHFRAIIKFRRAITRVMSALRVRLLGNNLQVDITYHPTLYLYKITFHYGYTISNVFSQNGA